MIVSGNNNHFQLGEESNCEINYEKCINPPYKSQINPLSILSYSIYFRHAVLISCDGQVYVIGDNSNCVISKFLPQLIFPKYTNYPIQDSKSRPCIAISAVCGKIYTIYLITSQDSSNYFQIAYQNHEGDFFFLPTEGHNPIALYGGCINAAAIDQKGEIILIKVNNKDSFSYKLPHSVIFRKLPGNEKAVKIACLDDFYLALSSTGQVYKADLDGYFSKISSFDKMFIIDISGTHGHCFVVNKEGHVFGLGYNYYHQLGPETPYEFENFTKIEPLSYDKIVNVFAGYHHSMFLTSEGKVLIYDIKGHNYFLQSQDKSVFCVAGNEISVSFINDSIPTSPNQKITNFSYIFDIVEQIKSMRSNRDKINIFYNVVASNEKVKENEDQNNNCFIKIIDPSDFHKLKIIREISSGGNGRVCEVESDRKYALKIMHTNDCSIEKQRNFIGEQEKLQILSHPNVIYTYGIFLSDETSPFSILLEYCPNDLMNAIKSNELSKVEIVKIIYQIVEAMHFIHSKGIIHRDLKPKNILIGNDGMIRVSDFGISKLMNIEEQTITTTISGTLNYMAPEILNQEKYDEKVDVYSFGVLLYYILSGGENPKITVVQVGNGKKAKIPETFTSFSHELINNCWNFNPKKRPSFQSIHDLLDKNIYQIVELTKKEANEVDLFIKKYKEQILKKPYTNEITQNPISLGLTKKMFKIILIGNSLSGKTSFMHQYQRGSCPDFLRSTISIDFYSKDIQWDDNTMIGIQFWDLGGHLIGESFAAACYHGTSGAFLFFDASNADKEFEIAKRWKEELDQKCFTSMKRTIPCLLVLNKCDLLNDNDFSLIKDRIERFVNENNFIGYTKISCLKGTNIQKTIDTLIKYIVDNNIEPYILKENDNPSQEIKSSKCHIY